MKTTNVKTVFILSISLLFVFNVSCEKRKLEKRLLGTWNVTNVDFTVAYGSIVFSGSGSNVVGTITFKKNGIGFQNYSFKYMNNTYIQDGNFTYSISNTHITTSHTDQWERIVNEKNIQKVKFRWVINANETRTYILTLQKQ